MVQKIPFHEHRSIIAQIRREVYTTGLRHEIDEFDEFAHHFALFNAAGDLLATAESDHEGMFKLSGQIATQDGLTIVVDPPESSGYYMVGELRCQFASDEYSGYSARTGEESYIGQLSVPRAEQQDNPDCLS